ncbi:MAG: restriction endonuclease [Nitrospirae bacterium]|nr:restriction endonuclease [Nitrospirota bacterium]
MMILFGYFKDYLRSLTDLALDFWYIVPVITAALAAKFFFDQWTEHKLSGSSINDIDSREIGDFISHLNDIVVRLGYIIEWVNHNNDHEVNMLIVKNGVKVLFRAVRNQGKIGWKPIQESLDAMRFHECHELIMVTNKYFTFRAREFAEENGVVLWDRDKLIKNLFDTKEEAAFELETSEADTVGNDLIGAQHVLSMDEYLSKKCGVCGNEVNTEDIQFCNDNSMMLKGGVYCNEHRKGV